jgi:hypothetical protein
MRGAYKGAEVLSDNWEVHFADFSDSSFDARFAGADCSRCPNLPTAPSGMSSTFAPTA